MGGEVVEIRRKTKRTGIVKYVRKFSGKFVAFALPTLRYTLVPGMLAYAVYFTEPQPSLMELINPFY